MLTILFIQHVDKQDKDFWETCNFVRNDDLIKVKERLANFPAHLTQKTANGITLFYFSKSEKMTSYLIEQGLSIHETDEWGNTPLHLAAYEGFTEAIAVYLQNGANVEAENRWGQKPHQLALTPATCDLFVQAQTRLDPDLQHITLYDAARQGKESAVKYMLEAGVDPNRLNHPDFQADRWESTPLHKAVYIGYHRIVELLLQHGANPNVHSGVSLYRSCYNALTVRALRKYGAKAIPTQLDQACWEAVVNVGNHALLQELIACGAPLDKKNLIHDAIRRVDQTTDEYPKILKILVQHRPELLESISKINETPLIKAVDMDNQLMVECLIELGADINQPNNANVTPLLQAIQRRNTKMVKWLIEHGANVTSEDNVGMSPYTRASFTGDTNMVELIENILKEQELPVPLVPSPPKASHFERSTEHFTHFFHDDDWESALFNRWRQDQFLRISHKLGFTNRYSTHSNTVASKVPYFFDWDELLMELTEHEHEIFVTQYFAFHPKYPDAWMMYINWWNQSLDIDYTQFHFRCPDELVNVTKNTITESDLISCYTLKNTSDDYLQLIQDLYTYSQKCLQAGLDTI